MKHSYRFFPSLLVALVSVLSLAGAQAQSSVAAASGGSGLYIPANRYLGQNVGQSDYSLGNGTGLFGSDRRTSSYSIYAGSYFNPNFGFEIGYTDFGKINRAGGSTRADGINLSLVGRAPMSGSFNLLGKVGTTYGRTEVSSAAGSGVVAGSESDFGWSYGLGAEYAFNPQLSAVLQYDEHNLKFTGGDRNRISATSLGLRYRY